MNGKRFLEGRIVLRTDVVQSILPKSSDLEKYLYLGIKENDFIIHLPVLPSG